MSCHIGTATQRRHLIAITTVFILAIILLVASACTVLVWAFASEVAERLPHGTKVGGVLCAVGALAVGVTVIAFFRVFIHSKHSVSGMNSVPERSESFPKQHCVTKLDRNNQQKPLHRSFSSAYVPVATSFLSDAGSVQVFSLLSGRGCTLSAMELNSPVSEKATNCEAGNVVSPTIDARAEAGDLSKVHSEVIVPVMFRHSAILSRSKPFRRSLSRSKYEQSSNQVVVKTIGDTSPTVGFLPKTLSEGFLLHADKPCRFLGDRATDDMAAAKLLAQSGHVNFAGMSTVVNGDNLDHRTDQSQTDGLRPHAADCQPVQPYMVSVPTSDSQLISYATVFDEAISDSEEIDVEKAQTAAIFCRPLRPFASPGADVFPAPIGQQDAGEQLLTVNQHCRVATKNLAQQRSFASRLRRLVRRLLRTDEQVVASEPGVDVDQSPTHRESRQTERTDQREHAPAGANLDTDSTSSVSRKPTLVSNASVFSLPTVPPAMWTADRPVWIMGLTDLVSDVIVVNSRNGAHHQATTSVTGSTSSVFAFHVRPPPRLRLCRHDYRVGGTSVDDHRQGVSRRTRSLGRILSSGDRQTLVPRS